MQTHWFVLADSRPPKPRLLTHWPAPTKYDRQWVSPTARPKPIAKRPKAHRANNLNQNSTSNIVEDIGDEDLNINRNNNVNFNQEASNQTRLAASRQVDNISDEEIQENIFIRSVKAVGNAIKNAFNWLASFFW